MASRFESDRWPPEVVAGVANALLVVALPFVLAIVAACIGPSQGGGAVAVIPGILPALRRAAVGLELIVVVIVACVPFALLTAWRTWVHALRYLRGESAGWQGVLEGGALGFLAALWVLRWGIIHRPAEAPPYIIAYGGAAFVLGLLLGSVLRLTAILVLKRTVPRDPPGPPAILHLS